MTNEQQQSEWKTIRIPAASYYKLSEISGFFSIIFGQRVPLSFTADMIIQLFYNNSHQNMVAMVSDPDRIEQARKELKGKLERLQKVLQPLIEGREK